MRRLGLFVLASSLCLAGPGCGGGGDGGTFLLVTVERGSAVGAVHTVDLTLALGSQTKTHTFSEAGGAEIMLPTTAVFSIAMGTGTLTATATARDSGGATLAMGSNFGTIASGETTRLTITLGQVVNPPIDGGVDVDGSVTTDAGPGVDGAVMVDAGVLVPAWAAFERIGHDDLANEVSNFNPKVAVSANGDALVTFYDQGTVWARRYVKARDGWDSLIQINDASSSGVNPLVAMDGNGNGVVVWYSNNVGGGVFGKRFTASLGWPAGWGTVDPVYAGAAGIQRQSTSLVMTPAGHAVVGVDQNISASSTREGYVVFFEVGQGWRPAIKVSGTTTSCNGTNVGLSTVGTSLRAVAAWYQSDAGRLNVLGSIITYDLTTHAGTAAAPQALEADATLDHLSPRVAMDGSGNAMAIFLQRDSTATVSHVMSNRLSGGTWAGAAGVDTAGQRASDYAITINATGAGVVVFRQCGNPCAIWARRFAGATFQAPDKLSADENTVSSPEVAIDGAGRALAVWDQNAAAVNSVFASELAPAAGWSAAHALEDDTVNAHNQSSVGLGSMGTGVAAWVRETPAPTMRRKIFGAVYKF